MSLSVSHPAFYTRGARFGARQIDDGHLSVMYRNHGGPKRLPAQAWQLQARDYPRLAKIINWWGEHHGSEIFEREDLGSRLTEVPVLGPIGLYLRGAGDKLVNLVLRKRMTDASLIKDYALTVDGKTAAVVRMTEQNRASQRYYERNYDNLRFDAKTPVYEIELLQAAFWNRNIQGQQRALNGKLEGATEALMLHIADRLPVNSEIIFTPDNALVNRLFKKMLTENNLEADIFYSRDLRGRTNVRGDDYRNDYPLLYRMKTADCREAARKMKAALAALPVDEASLAGARHALDAVNEPVTLVRKAGFPLKGGAE